MFKKNVNLVDFIQLLCGPAIVAKPVDVSVLKDQFKPEDLMQIENELSDFRIIALFLLVFDGSFRNKLSISEEEMGRIIGKTMVTVCQNSGVAIEKAKELMNKYFEYLQAISNNKEEEIAEKGFYFFACKHFAKKMLPNVNLMNELQRLKQFSLFDAAKQVYRSVNKTFVMAQKKVRIEI